MARNLADLIEEYLESLLVDAPEGSVEVQRGELAERFGCAPSQINYVLDTRFTYAQGFLVESRRGSGGYLRIVKLPAHAREVIRRALEHGPETMSQVQAERCILRLHGEGIITAREARLMAAALRRETLALGLPWRDEVRARVFRAMLLELARDTAEALAGERAERKE
ncbi:MAG: CtsR family transcriptional regulator [Bacillota bacterium]|nr:CtsR family transcriptional regulator [Bacillota bacterium]